jgi:hypothetical protein
MIGCAGRKSLLSKAQQRPKYDIKLGRQNNIKGVLGAKKIKPLWGFKNDNPITKCKGVSPS